MHIRDIEKLKVWLLKKLEPLCDADPAALAKYIVALLRKDKPRSSLRELCIDQLEVFLAKETPPFVETLFSVLDSEEYLSSGRQGNGTAAAANSNNSQQTPTQSGEERTSPSGYHGYDRRPSEDSRHKEVDDDDRDFRRSRRGGVVTRDSSPHRAGAGVGGGRRGRIEPPRRTVRQRISLRQEDRGGRGPRGRSRSRSRSTTPDLETATGGGENRKRELPAGVKLETNGPPNKKQRCKDYDEKGVCMLGEQCPYDHGVDPFVISPITGTFPPYAPPPFPLLPPQIPTIQSKANTGLLLSTINSHHPPPPAEPDAGYNPEDPAITSTAPPSIIPPPPPPLLPPLQLGASFPPSLPGIPPSFHPPPSLPPPTSNTRPFLSHNRGVVPMSGAPRMPSRPSDSIVLHKVPQQLNTITKLSGHFEKFGTIVNLQVRYDSDPESALIQFSSPAEAKAAHDCVEAVLNNRFIKVYYLKKGPQGQWTGKKVETATNTPGAIAVANIRPDAMTSSQPHPSAAQSATTTANLNKSEVTTTSHTNSVLSTSVHDHASKQQQSPAVATETHHAQRTVVPSPTLSFTAEKRLELQQKTNKLLQLQIQQQKLLLNKLEKSGKSLSAEEKAKVVETLKSLSSSISKLRDTLASATKTALIKDPVRKHPQPRDHAPQSPDAITSDGSGLQVKATQLRNEARKLGILPDSVTPSQGTGGAGEWAGKKKPDLRSKLDSRPRQILVVGAKDKDALTTYFESFGGLNQVEVDPDNQKNLIFTFRTRGIAEKAVRNGSVFQGTPLIMKWYSPKPPPVISSSGPLSTISLEENGQSVVSRPKVTPLNLEGIKHEEQPLPQRRTSISPSLDSLLLSPNTTATNPRVVHLVEDDEEEDEERSWRR